MRKADIAVAVYLAALAVALLATVAACPAPDPAITVRVADPSGEAACSRYLADIQEATDPGLRRSLAARIRSEAAGSTNPKIARAGRNDNWTDEDARHFIRDCIEAGLAEDKRRDE